ncbi:MAG: hypothetical protein JO184_02365 [Gammaproteobacteria bacterium]|nr:hypothetical protein [Gammaproteobacteria bacterium]
MSDPKRYRPTVDLNADYRVPSMWMRCLGILGSVFMVGYGAIGVWRDDLHVSLSKSDHSGVHLRGALAWLCFVGIVMMSIGLIRFLAPASDEGGQFDFDARRRRHGPLFFLGLALFVVAQAIADWR